MQRVLIQRPVFLCCDIQSGFSNLIHQFPLVVATAQKMTKASNILSIPLIVTEQYPQALGSTVQDLDISHAALKEAKTKFSMITPKVEEYFEKNQVKSAVLFGIESHVCVTQTALDLLRLQCAVYVLQDGVSSQNKGEIPIALNRLREAGCTITSSESILFQIMQDSKHPNFKQISALVKETKNTTKETLTAFSIPYCQ